MNVIVLSLLLVVVGTRAEVRNGTEASSEKSITEVHDVTEYNNETVLSPAEELLQAARAAGYDLTLQRLDIAAASTDEEVEEMMPQPVAEAFIAQRRRDNVDLIREQMIGMIFTGRPQPLGSVPRRPLAWARPASFRSSPSGMVHMQYNPQGEASIQSTRKVPAPDKILKPMPFVPGPTMVKFPPHHPPHQQAPPAPSRQSPGFPDFSNTIGPDFGPVTINEYSGNFNSPNTAARPPSGHRPSSSHRPSLPRPAPHPSSPRLPPRQRPPLPRPPRPIHGRPGAFSNVGFGNFRGNGGNCVRYTEDICLDTEEYPHEAILSSLVRDPSRADTMIAEVRSQSADDLVDGVSSAQESKYDFQHYFGNRRADTVNHAHRDFAQDGGFLCPAEVKYARPKRARNSKGVWKYIVNMDKYSQTIRMEKCMKPGGACSYVSHHYRATCNQIYNYHRLLSWDDGRGLHMDIFKVPSCCSCHIQGYAYVFPPLNKLQTAAGSEQVIQAVPAPPLDDSTEVPSSEAPEPVQSQGNFRNVESGPPGRQRRPSQRSEGSRRPAGPWPARDESSHSIRSRMQEVEEHSQQVTGQPPSSRLRPHNNDSARTKDTNDKVNYGYHPIIDFFSPYRLQNRRK
ncbi:uncharacterized protein [Cherax quadricarinatus]|uniref:uncharacterized protein isoform X3 n=1 Tax=Cherax quadricarinatus TaxID=27406 RepID=UPI0023793DF6|nr:uncharacterized protein LOC128692935 isoform X3 [Cherax quadricarinatus]